MVPYSEGTLFLQVQEKAVFPNRTMQQGERKPRTQLKVNRYFRESLLGPDSNDQASRFFESHSAHRKINFFKFFWISQSVCPNTYLRKKVEKIEKEKKNSRNLSDSLFKCLLRLLLTRFLA